MTELREGICACGCGEHFWTRSDTRIWLNSGHQQAAYAEANKTPRIEPYREHSAATLGGAFTPESDKQGYHRLKDGGIV